MTRYRILAVVVILLLVVVSFSPGSAVAADEIGPSLVYFPLTGHHLANSFLQFWRQNGDIPVFGLPITEAYLDSRTGLLTQYFERAVFQLNPNTPKASEVQLAPVGSQSSSGRLGEGPFRPVVATSDANVTFCGATGHRLSFAFRLYWHKNGGQAIFGFPISEEFTENGKTVQYFEKARFEWQQGTPDRSSNVTIGLLGVEAAKRAGVDTSPVIQVATVPAYSPALFYQPYSPDKDYRAVVPAPGAPVSQTQWIEVDLSKQCLRAWERDQVVFSEYVSTGISIHPTPTGYFKVFQKISRQTMTNGPQAPAWEYYNLPNVPDVMYFQAGGYAIHGTYWHHNFGTPMSHGCVNMTLEGAQWLYNWTPYGTTVWIHW